MATLEEDLIHDILRGSPGHLCGTRPIHAPGIAATGCFRATDVARAYTRAVHFDGRPVPVTVRLSDGTGLPIAPHSTPVVRGMAVKFHLGTVTEDPNGVLRSTDETNLVGVTLGVFFSRTIGLFREFCVAATPVPVVRRPWWATLRDMVTLRAAPEPPRGASLSSADALFGFANTFPAAAPAISALGALPDPESYVTCSYHPIHAFGLTAASGAIQYVRFHWEPVAGVRAAQLAGESVDLRAELRQRVKAGAAEFVLRADLAEAGDDLVDVMRPWPPGRRRVVLGHLRLTAVPADQVNGNERLMFDPTRLVDGIDYHPGDEIMIERGRVYPVSLGART